MKKIKVGLFILKIVSCAMGAIYFLCCVTWTFCFLIYMESGYKVDFLPWWISLNSNNLSLMILGITSAIFMIRKVIKYEEKKWKENSNDVAFL